MNLGAVVRLSRPFTLLAPAVGMVAAGLASLGHRGAIALDGSTITSLAVGALCAGVLNIASNAVNQIFDLEVDRINKPERPLPAGDMTVREAGIITVVAYVVALALAAALNTPLLLIVAATAALTYAYSGPPLRTKRHWAFANITIAAPRGFLLPIAGWLTTSGELPTWGERVPADILLFATASGLFILGAATTKDYADLEGDEAGGCITLPLKLGVERSVKIVAPFLCLPWLLLPAGVAAGLVGGNHAVLFWGGLLLAAVGARAAWLLVTRPEALTSKSTHPAWVLMYLLMVGSQLVFAATYVTPAGWMAGTTP